MKHLKIIEKGWEGYTGLLGMTAFQDGVSTEPVPQFMADRISSTVQVVELDDTGGEVQAGAAARLIGGATLSIEPVAELAKATVEEIAEERRVFAEAAHKPPVDVFYSLEQLEAIADKRGIRGLREVALPWGVKGRAIDELIGEIMVAQNKFQARLAADAEAKAAEQAAAMAATAIDETVALPSEASLAVLVAAETTQAQIELPLEPVSVEEAPVEAAPAEAAPVEDTETKDA